MLRSSGVVAAVLVLAAVVVPAQTQQPTPRFRTGVEAVVLDVSVIDRDRRPVRGLVAADFTVLEDGQPQTIQTFSAIDFPDVVDTTTAAWTRNVGPDVRRNDDFADRRSVTIVLDDAVAMRDGDDVLWTRRMAKDVVRQMGPRDLVSVVYPLDKSHGQDFTTDHALLDAAIDRFNNGDSRNVFVTWHALLSTLRGVVENLSGLPQHLKILVLVSAGIPLVPPPTASGERNPLAPPDMVTPGEYLRDAIAELQDLFQAARRANVTVYPIDPAGLVTPGKKTIRTAVAGRDFLISVGNTTGGFAVVDTNDTPAAVARIYHENSSYYVLGYTSSNLRREGKTRKIDVRVNRPGLTVRTRSGYVEPHSARASSKPTVSPSPVWTALAAPTPERDLPLQMTAAAFPMLPGREATVVIVARVSPPQGPAVMADGESVDVLVNAYDPKGDRKAGTRLTAMVVRQPNEGGEAGFEVHTNLELAPGRYQVRLAAAATGVAKSGSVFYDLEVPDFAKQRLALSGLALSVNPARPPAPTLASGSLVPTSTRAFRPGDDVVLFAQVSQGGKRPVQPVAMRAWVVDEHDQTVFERSDTLDPSRFEPGGRVTDIRLTIPVATLHPGLHLLTLEVRAGSLTSRREVRFAVLAQ